MCGRSQVLRVLLDIAKLTRYFGAMPESGLRQYKSLVSALYLEDIVESRCYLFSSWELI
ncbi:hypothetical protein BKA69DRAFT_1106033 [Paraphysoderma sedebokerense]|nr:hypothetical protein BKA69DRAFT_1106033 [Paraphysoderma sedebokerense]